MNTKYYIAYCSNLNKAQMKRRCPTAMPFATATLENYELLFRGKRDCAVATIEPKNGGKVPVAIWEITDMDEKSLDRYEGYPYLYRKEELEVKIGNEKIKVSDVEYTVDGVFILRPTIAPNELFPNLELDGNYIKIDRKMQTNIEGLYAAGDCTGLPLQVAKAVGEGLVAGQSAMAYVSKSKKNK